jgi:ABC-type uncharacterized transport system permease subunit
MARRGCVIIVRLVAAGEARNRTHAMMHTLIGLLAAAIYASATLLLVRDLRGGTPRRPLILGLTAAALVLHAFLLQSTIPGADGLDLGFFNALSLVGWVAVLLLLMLAIGQPVTSLGLGLLPFAGLTVLAALALSNGQPGPMIPPRPSGIDVHVLLSICAYAVLTLAAMQSVLLGIQHRQLHEHRPTRVMHVLPPLYVMETLLFRMTAIGFALLTLALGSGFVFLEDMFAQDLVHKTVLSLVAWAVFGVLLAGHHFAGWRGPTAVKFTLGGFVLLVLGYFGSKLVLELILGRA